MNENAKRQALLCTCAERKLLPGEELEKTLSSLTLEGWQVTQVPDLCMMAAQAPSSLSLVASSPELLVAACHSRAVYWLLHHAGVERPAGSILFRDLRPEPAAGNAKAVGATGNAPQTEWPAWFPVIDYSRCTGCRQCVNFCAFGVYSVQDRKVRVTAPAHCKDNCPACARICPTLAIIFPKAADTPINGMDVKESDLAGRKTAPNAEDANGGLQAILASRRQKIQAMKGGNEGRPPS